MLQCFERLANFDSSACDEAELICQSCKILARRDGEESCADVGTHTVDGVKAKMHYYLYIPQHIELNVSYSIVVAIVMSHVHLHSVPEQARYPQPMDIE